MRLTTRLTDFLRTALLALVLVPPAARAAPVPKTLGYEGRLLREGAPSTGVLSVHFAIFGSADGGSALWDEEQTVAVTDGFYATFLGSVVPLRNDTFDGTERYLEMTVEGEVLAPRQRVGSVGYALRADVASSVAGGTVDATSISVNGHTVIDTSGHLAAGSGYTAGSGIVIDQATHTIALPVTCTNNQVLKWNGSGWACDAAGPTYAAGAGLELSSGAFSLLSSCRAGEILKWDGANWACSGDLNTRLTVAADSGLEIDASALSLTRKCAAGQILKFAAATGWGCAADDDTGTVTSVTGSGPITVATGTTTPAISIAQATSATNGYVSAVDWATFNGKLGSGSAAGGDLSGSLPNPTVARLQGNAVSATAPATSQVLKWDGSAWTPAADLDTNSGGTVTSVAIAAGTPLAVANATSTPTLTMTAATSVSPGYLSAADWATFNAKGTSNVSGVTGTAPVTVGGTAAAPVVSMAAASSSGNGYLSAADWATFSGKLGASSAAGGDVSGTFGALTVGKLQGNAVSATAPTLNQVLRWDGASWAGSADTSGTVTSVTAGTGLSGGIITGTGTIALANTAVTAGTYGSATTVPSIAVDAQGRVTGASTVTISGVAPGGSATGDLVGSYPNPTVAKLQGNAVSATAPTSGQMLAWNGSAWAATTPTGGTVTSVSGSGPLSVATGTSTPAVSIAKATSGSDGYLSAADWATFNAKGSGTVTSVTAGTGLSGGSITGAGSISLANTTVTAGSYTRASITVDAQGRLASASSGPAVSLTADVAGTLPIANGGTGITAAPTAAGQYLRSSGANTWAVGAVASSDVITALGYTPVNKSGDTMTGVLTLPSNGLAVGTGQLVVNGGNVGIGTPTPGAMLEVNGAVKIGGSETGVALNDLKAYIQKVACENRRGAWIDGTGCQEYASYTGLCTYGTCTCPAAQHKCTFVDLLSGGFQSLRRPGYDTAYYGWIAGTYGSAQDMMFYPWGGGTTLQCTAGWHYMVDMRRGAAGQNAWGCYPDSYTGAVGICCRDSQ